MSSPQWNPRSNQTADRLGKDFAELESSRQELMAMLDSMQEAVVAITADGTGALVRTP